MAEPKRPNNLVFNEALLKDFIDGRLEPAVESKVAKYLESKPELLERVVAKSGDGFLQRLKNIQQRSHSQAQPIVEAEAAKPAVARQTSALKDESVPTQLANYAGYKITKELGRGGMGVVYLAKNIQMDRLEVLKVLNERLLDHDGAKGRFLREIRAVSKLSHTNIVTSYSILPLDDLMVFAMEYVHGIDLHQYTHKYKPLPVGLACSFAKQIAAGLQHAHQKGLVHRDIKPSNIIVYKSDGQLQLKILDFGLAKANSEEAANVGGLTQDGTMLGTPEYMSPEQSLNAAKADIRADIYSLGCTLYFMLTGKPPFTGTHGSLIMAHAQQEPAALNLVRPEIPTELAAIVGKMMAKDVLKRFQTPSEVAKALVPFINGSNPVTNAASQPVPAAPTINDLDRADRETSVEVPLSDVRSAPVSQATATSTSPVRHKPHLRPAHSSQGRHVRQQRPRNGANWFVTTAIGIGALFVLGLVWQLAALTFRTPNGTIVVENLPADAEVLIDGQKVEIAWNNGKDKAEVHIDAGSHQLRVRNQGNEIFGDKVSVKGGDSTIVKLRVVQAEAPATTDLPNLPASALPVASTTEDGAMAGVSTVSIPKDASPYNDKLYKVYSEVYTWHQAEEECRKLGGRLVEIYDDKQNAFIFTLVKKTTTRSAVWLGATDERLEGEWLWGTGRKMEYSNWGKNQPNDKGDGEDYLMMNVDFPADSAFVSRWSDQPDRAESPLLPGFVCEWEAPTPNSLARPSDGWQSIFNGTDLTGWRGDTKMWWVRDGCITGRVTATDNLTSNTCLVWDGGELTDFEIEFDGKINSSGNSGLQFRSQPMADNPFGLKGYRLDMDGKGKLTGMLFEEQGRGILANQFEIASLDSDGGRIVKSMGDSELLRASILASGWNHFRLVAKGPRLQCFVNSQLTSEVNDLNSGKAAQRGSLGFQLQTLNPKVQIMEAQFKNVKLRSDSSLIDIKPSNNSAPQSAKESTQASEPTSITDSQLRDVLLSHRWYYEDNLYPPSPNCRFREDGTWHDTWKWKYRITGPREITVQYDRSNKDPNAGVKFTFTNDLRIFTGQFTDSRGRVHKIKGTRRD